jgi:hypothetical protein
MVLNMWSRKDLKRQLGLRRRIKKKLNLGWTL